MSWAFGRKPKNLQEKTAEELFQDAKKLSAQKKYKESHEIYLLAADKGHAGAMNNIGCQYRDGKGVEPNRLKAKEWFEKSFSAGSEYAACNLGNLYAEGVDGIEQDFDKAFPYYYVSCKKGYVPAMIYLATSYYEGLGCDINYKLAAYWALKSIQNGDEDAYYILGELYKHGYYYPKCPAYARYCYEKASVGFEDATFESFLQDDEDDEEMNEQIRNIRPVKPNFLVIDNSYPEFETEKDPYQMWVEGSSYLKGLDIYDNLVKVDAQKGREMLELSAKRGCVSAMTSLAYRYFDVGQGDGVKYNRDGSVEYLGADNQKVIYYYKMAAECGDKFSIEALAELYTCGEQDIEPNKELAKKYWTCLYEIYQEEDIKKKILDNFDEEFEYHKIFREDIGEIQLEW